MWWISHNLVQIFIRNIFFRTQTTGPVATPTMTTLLLLCLPSLREEGLWLNLLHRSPTTILSNSPRLPSTDRQSCRKDCRNWPSRQENSSSELIILTAMSAKYEISIYCFRISHFELFFSRILVPEDTFFDAEQGNTRNLALDLRHENGSVIRNNWLRFDPQKQAIYAW